MFDIWQVLQFCQTLVCFVVFFLNSGSKFCQQEQVSLIWSQHSLLPAVQTVCLTATASQKKVGLKGSVVLELEELTLFV